LISLPKISTFFNLSSYDAQGITAAFNLNILRHLNHRFDGDFDIDLFEHCAFYNQQQHQIEMHLRSLVTQTVFFKALNYQFILNAGETIHTEISRKFDLSKLVDNLASHAFKPLQIWTDPRDWFGLLLCQRQCTGDDCP
jgi:L-histidine Nalpha-methyltransferase